MAGGFWQLADRGLNNYASWFIASLEHEVMQCLSLELITSKL